MKYQLHSTALYSSFCLNDTFNTLFDAGEGIAVTLKNKIFAIDRVFITHDHWDHIGGLMGLVSARSVARGDKEKPITIYYPEGINLKIKSLVNSVARIPVNWIEVTPYLTIPLTKKHYIYVFPVNHSFKSLGYAIIEKRSRLATQYKNKSGDELRDLKREGIKINENYSHPIFVYTLDSSSIDKNIAQDVLSGADHWIADCTFLNHKDKDCDTHMSIRDIWSYVDTYHPKHVVLGHISSRYNHHEISQVVSKYFDMSVKTKISWTNKYGKYFSIGNIMRTSGHKKLKNIVNKSKG